MMNDQNKKYSAALRRSMKFYTLMDRLPYNSDEWKKAEKEYRKAEQEMARLCQSPKAG